MAGTGTSDEIERENSRVAIVCFYVLKPLCAYVAEVAEWRG